MYDVDLQVLVRTCVVVKGSVRNADLHALDSLNQKFNSFSRDF